MKTISFPISFVAIISACGGTPQTAVEPTELRAAPLDPNVLVGDWYGCRSELLARDGNTDAYCFGNYVEGDHWTFDGSQFRHAGSRMEENADAQNEDDAIRQRNFVDTGTYTLRRAEAYESPIDGALVATLSGGETTVLLLMPTDQPTHFMFRTRLSPPPSRPAPEQLIGEWLRCEVGQPPEREGCNHPDLGIYYARMGSAAASDPGCDASQATQRLSFDRHYRMIETRSDGSTVHRAYRQLPDDATPVTGDEMTVQTIDANGSAELRVRMEVDRVLIADTNICLTGPASP